MYDAELNTIETCRLAWERHSAAHAPGARATAGRYMDALGALIDAFNQGPGADPRRMDGDTTGALSRAEDEVEWAEAERHRVRKALRALA